MTTQRIRDALNAIVKAMAFDGDPAFARLIIDAEDALAEPEASDAVYHLRSHGDVTEEQLLSLTQQPHDVPVVAYEWVDEREGIKLSHNVPADYELAHQLEPLIHNSAHLAAIAALQERLQKLEGLLREISRGPMHEGHINGISARAWQSWGQTIQEDAIRELEQ